MLTVAYTLEQCWHRVPGGTAVAAVEAARALAARDDVHLVGVAARHRRPPSAAVRPPVFVAHAALPRPLLYEAWHGVGRPLVEDITGPVDAVHATSLVIPPTTRPLVATVHDLAFLHEPAHFTRRGVRFFRKGFELVRQRADLVLCPSLATMDDCEAHGIDPGRLRHVPWGVGGTPAAPDAVAEVRRRYRLERPFLAYAGTIEPRKNLPRLLAAFARLPGDDELVLIGPAGWGTDGDDLLAAAGAAASRVRSVGFVSDADKAALLAAADVLVYPSLWEGFGLPVLEAMVQGTPVVTSRGRSTEEAAGGAAVLVDPLDVDDIVRGITAARAAAPDLARRGWDRAATMTWARTAALTAAAYRDVAS